MRKLILEADNEAYEITDPKKFDTISNDDLKVVYYNAFMYQRIQRILDELEEDEIIEQVEVTKETREYEENLKYTFNFLEDLLRNRLGSEFNTYRNWCEDEFGRMCMKEIENEE